MGSHRRITILNSNFWTSAGVSPSSGARLGAGVSLRLLPPLALLMMLCGAFFSQTAYATSYINISSGAGGTVSLGSIKPSATGVSASGSDTLTITTNCSAGYSVYVSAQNGGDTNLTNTNSSVTTNNTISASSTAVGSTATTLNSNTWGITGDSASASASKYVGLPSYADATNTALISNSSASTTGDNKSTVYYGVKVDTTLTPGTYSGDVLYTTLVSDKCNNYTVHFNANGGSGSMSDQTIPVGAATPLTASGFSRSGYAFLGWATSASGKTGTATNGIGTESDVDYRDGQSVTDIASFNSTVNLYAIWLAVDGDMQSFSTCANLSVGESKMLRDTRDNKAYAIKKLPDGKCWMVQNLRLVGERTLTPSDSDVSSNFNLKASTEDPNITNWCTDESSDCVDKSQAYYEPSEAADSSKSSYYGALYNWYAATAGTGTRSTGFHAEATSSICPRDWHLPKGGNDEATNDFVTLDIAWGGTGANRNNANTYSIFTETYINGNNGGFSLAGSVNGPVRQVGYSGSYWTSNSGNVSGEARQLTLSRNNAIVYPKNNYFRYVGNSVRCIADYDYLISYSSDGSDSGEPSKTSDGAVLTSDSVTMPTQGTLAKDGYEFKGWALTSGASDATYTAEQAVSVSALITAASSAGQTTTPGSTITLYPVWEQSIDMTTMQGWAEGNGCSALATNEYLTLKDSRDDNEYVVKKLADGKCWMVQNLRLTNYKLTSADSDVSSDFTLTASTGTPSSSTWCTTDSSTCDDKSLVYYDSSQTSSSSNSSYYGALYNWYAATAGTGTYSTGADVTVSSSICPKGWHLPKGGTDKTTNEFSVLDVAWGGTGANRTGANTYSTFTGAYGTGDNGGFGLAGYIGGSVLDVDSYGGYWSSTAYSASRAYHLGLGKSSTYVSPQNNSHKYYGYSVRCVADTPTMQETSCSSLATETTTALRDSRDNQTYTVYRIPTDQTYSGSSTVANIAGKCIMTKDLSLGYVTGGSITAGSNLSLTTAASNFDSNASNSSYETVSYDTTETVTYVNSADGGAGWSETNSYTNKQYTNGPRSGYETYSSHTYYSWGAALVVCPKGWRLPTSAEYGTNSPSASATVGLAAIVGNGADGSKALQASPWSFVLGGFFYSSGWNNQGSDGVYWSSTQSSSTGGYYLYFNSSSVYRNNSFKYYGRSVRCIAD